MAENTNIYDTLIIGSGPAGLTAAIYNIRAFLKTIVIAGNQPGGQLTITTTVENYPGFPNGTGGIKLMMDMQTQVKNLGGEIKSGIVQNVQIPLNPPLTRGKPAFFQITLDNGEILQTKSIIIATGAKIKWLGLPKEKGLIGKGISGCATCDGMFFKNKIVAVIGGGDTACEEAVFLSRFASKVYMIHRRDNFRASEIEQKNVFENEKIEIIWNSEITEINPSVSDETSPLDKGEKLNAIRIKNNQTNEEKILEIDGMFVAIGYNPATEFVKDILELDEIGHVKIGKNIDFPMMTSINGIFAAGDCVNHLHRQAIIAAGDGAKAGLEAEKWLKSR
jgi:thioredoxin reductase (NADPH)